MCECGSISPGVTTVELDSVAAGVLSAHGARSAPALVYGFPGTVLISINDEVVHTGYAPMCHYLVCVGCNKR